MRNESKPVILVSQIRGAVRDGAWIEIECEKSAFRDGNMYRGAWRAYVCDFVRGSEDVDRAVCVSAGNLTPRVFKTIVGVSGFAMELGMRKFELPLAKGETSEWRPDPEAAS